MLHFSNFKLKYLNRAFQLFDRVVLLKQNILKLLILAYLLELSLSWYFRLVLRRNVLWLLYKDLYFSLGHFQDTFDGIRCACDYVIDVIFANLVVELFQYFFWLIVKSYCLEYSNLKVLCLRNLKRRSCEALQVWGSSEI